MNIRRFSGLAFRLGLALVLLAPGVKPEGQGTVFSVRDYGTTGNRNENSQPAIQKAIDACAEAGGGTVYFPPGEYTSGTVFLRSNVRLYLEAGATLFSAKGKDAFPKDSLIWGEGVTNIALEGRGTIDGQGEYEWRLNDIDDRYIHPNLLLMEQRGKPLMRSFPTKDSAGHLVQLVRCRDVRISGLSFVRSPSWTIHPWGCERLVIDGVYIMTSLKDGVWADGIDPDGCRDVRISNCTIETGDDALVFYSSSIFGPPLPCENITVTNCRLTSSSSALKFCDGNLNCIRNVTIDNCVITNSNRGIAFMVFDGGYVSDVVISNMTVECTRRDWFWWGDGDPIHFNVKRRNEIDPRLKSETQPPAGSIRNVILKNVIARGKGTSLITGHPDSWLEGITLENIKLFISSDPSAPYEKVVHGLDIQMAKNLKMRNIEVVWESPEADTWQSALFMKSIQGLELDGFNARQPKPGSPLPAVSLNQVEGAIVTRCQAPRGTSVFLQVSGERSKGIFLFGNNFRQADVHLSLSDDVNPEEIQLLNNLLPKKSP